MSSDTLSEYGVIPESDAYRSVGDQLAAQQRERIAQSMLDGRAWAYQRAGLPVPDGDATDAPREETRTTMHDGLEARRAKDRPWAPAEPAVIARARALIEADHDRWVAIDKADLAELVALAVAP